MGGVEAGGLEGEAEAQEEHCLASDEIWFALAWMDPELRGTLESREISLEEAGPQKESLRRPGRMQSLPQDLVQDHILPHLSHIDKQNLQKTSQTLKNLIQQTREHCLDLKFDTRANDKLLLHTLKTNKHFDKIDVTHCPNVTKHAIQTSSYLNSCISEIHSIAAGHSSWTPEQLLRCMRPLNKLSILSADCRANGSTLELLRVITHPAVRLRKLVLHRSKTGRTNDVPLSTIATALKRKAEWLHDVDATSGGHADIIDFISCLLSGRKCQVRNVALSGVGPRPLSDMALLASSLKSNERLESLSLGNNFFNHEGCLALSSAIGIHPSLCTLALEHNPIGDKGVAALCDAIEATSSLRHVSLSFVGAGQHTCEALTHAIERGVKLQTVDLGGNLISPDGAETLAQCLTHENCSLRSLNLSANHRLGSGGALALISALTIQSCPLENLALAGCGVGPSPCGRIGVALSRAPRLLKLDLSYNQLGDFGAWDLAWSLAESTTRLSTLLLRSNDIEDDGAAELCTMLRQNSSITFLDLSGNQLDCASEKFFESDSRIYVGFQSKFR